LSHFYTNVFSRGDKVYLRGYDEGKLIEHVINYKPYLFVPQQNGKYTTIDGKDVGKLEFSSIKEAKEFISTYEDVSNFDIYGLTNFPYLYIYDKFPGTIKYDVSLISIVSLDIECRSDNGFPSIAKADKEITAITIRKNGKSYVFGCGEFTTTDKDITYVKCNDEYELLSKFIQVWNFSSIKPDILTGWNIEFFDIPYLINRMKLILGDTEYKKLSPWGLISEKEVSFKGKENQTYEIHGISVLDYYQLYRKFKFGNQESYKLDYIAQEELGQKKLDYSEYGSLEELYKNNYQKFIEYNILDTILVDRLEEKLGFIQLVIAFAFDAKVNFNDTMTTVKPWDIIIHNYLLDRRIVIPQFKKNKMEDSLVGGYVKDPKIGLSKWVVSFDFDSLYPHLIMMFNISPEMFEGRLEPFDSIDGLLEEKINYSKEQTTADVSVAANGCMYEKDKQGFLPALMEKMYNDRILYKNEMIKCKKSIEAIKKEIKQREAA
jgi:DNA polymerase elongation subunit (family B)